MINISLNDIVQKTTIEKTDTKLFWKYFVKHANEVINTPEIEFCEVTGCAFEIKEENRKIVRTLIDYFCGIEDFNKYEVVRNNPSLEKGLLVFGDCGVGKTVLFEIIRRVGRDIYSATGVKRMLFKKISCGSFVSAYMMATKSKNMSFDLKEFQKGRLFIDDLGFEKLAFNQYELMEQILFERYSKNALTFLTTNLTPSEIENRYGKRIGDRLQEMFNYIKWEGNSFRDNL
ncbi:hypothetical protein ACOSP6_10935 [Tenacibaculum sp. MEBiC06402]|uniref:hypothetical protein n=1 Tax=unclassified Tenacibaculum TaxID=2635139 RepID=UPI003B9B95F9